MKRTTVIFLSAFVLNLVWENIHSYLYSNYMGGEITQFILVRASLFDALLITVILLPFIYLQILKNRVFLMLLVATIIAIINEWYGLSTNRWMYNSFMPIIPIIETGLTPTIQLGVTGYISYILDEHINHFFQ